MVKLINGVNEMKRRDCGAKRKIKCRNGIKKIRFSKQCNLFEFERIYLTVKRSESTQTIFNYLNYTNRQSLSIMLLINITVDNFFVNSPKIIVFTKQLFYVVRQILKIFRFIIPTAHAILYRLLHKNGVN